MVETKRTSTKGSGLILIAISLVIVAVCAAGALYLYNNPDVLEGLAYNIALAVCAIAAIAVLAYVVYLIVGVFYYATRGEITQDGISYGIDNVESVESKPYEDDKE